MFSFQRDMDAVEIAGGEGLGIWGGGVGGMRWGVFLHFDSKESAVFVFYLLTFLRTERERVKFG